MSDVNASAGPSARDVRAQAAQWLERRQREGWSNADQAELDLWLSQSLAHRTAYWRVSDAWSRADRLRALGNPVHELKKATPHLLLPIFFRLAAGIAAIAVLSIGAAVYFSRADERVYSTDVGGRELISFADGTRIELNTETVLRTRMTTHERIVWLDKGEAYFRVTHDAAHPFVVYAGARRVTDLGTAFLMRRDTGSLKVALLEGHVRIGAAEADTPSQSALLVPGDEVVATAESMSVKHKSTGDLKSETTWRRGMLTFKYTPLADAITEFNRYNRQKLIVTDPAIARMTIYGVFPTDDVEAFVDVARHVLRLHVQRRNGDIVISR